MISNVPLFFAGSGKSSVTRVISMWSEKNLRVPGSDPNKPRVLLCAPTGKLEFIRYILLLEITIS